MKKYITYSKCNWLLILLTTLLMSCEDFIETGQPDSQLTGETVFNNVATAEAALTNIYSKFSNDVLVCGNSKGISILLGSYADELQTYNTGLTEHQFFLNNIIPANTDIAALWNGSYNLIYAANAVKEGVENSTGIQQDDKNRLIGEALFLRAYIHFHLLNLFGEIPYVTTTDYAVNKKIGKLTSSELYTVLVDDLEHAKTLMPAINQSMLRVRPSVDAVKALLARIYLYNNNWEAAQSEANAVIGSGNFVWVDNLDAVFLKNSTGTIWQIMPGQEGLPTQEGQSFIFSTAPPPNRALSQELVNGFEIGDQRKEHWTGNVSENGIIYYYPNKYKQFNNGTESSEYSILMRLEELYLIRGEARMHLGDFDGAREDINKIRNRASLGYIIANTEQEILDAIIQERRIELFSELGHRFFDLKRTGRINSVLASVKPGWNATDILWPKPESELLLNPNLLPQNAGY